MILPKFQFVGRHGLSLVSGIYLAGGLAHVIGKLAPNFRLSAFILLSLVWVLAEVALILRELNGNRESLTSLGIGALPTIIVGCAVVALITRIIAHYEPAPIFSLLFAEFGLVFWIGGYFVMMRTAYHDKKLEEDLAEKPTPSNKSLQPTAGRSDD